MHKTFNVKGDFELSLNESSVITLLIDDSNVNITYLLQDGDYQILVFNNTNSNVSITEKGKIVNSTCKITYIELNNNEYVQTSFINVYKNSSLTVNSIYLGVNKKNIVFDIYNRELNTDVSINNNVVCLNDADFSLSIIGNIDKGAKNSKCMQKSQCLTFEDPKKAKVIPVLNIDENDVEAAHSLSSGTIDEDVLFYMNARGLTKKEALGLMLVSYLMPNEDFYKDYEKGLDIKELADRKVDSLCLI